MAAMSSGVPTRPRTEAVVPWNMERVCLSCWNPIALRSLLTSLRKSPGFGATPGIRQLYAGEVVVLQCISDEKAERERTQRCLHVAWSVGVDGDPMRSPLLGYVEASARCACNENIND